MNNNTVTPHRYETNSVNKIKMLCFFRVLYVLSFSHFLYFFLRYFFCSVKWLLFNERWQWRKRWKMSSNSKDSPFFICSFFFLFSSNDAHRVFRWIPLEIMFILLLNQISPPKIYKWLLILFHFNLFPFTAVNNLRHKKMLTHYELVYILLAIFNGKVFQKDVDQIECLFKFGFFDRAFVHSDIIPSIFHSFEIYFWITV